METGTQIRKCNKCLETKPISAFRIQRKRPEGLSRGKKFKRWTTQYLCTTCKRCESIIAKRRHHTNKSKGLDDETAYDIGKMFAKLLDHEPIKPAHVKQTLSELLRYLRDRYS